jgi:hypothetical protein
MNHRKKKPSRQVIGVPAQSQLERDLAALTNDSAVTRLRSLMKQMSSLEQSQPRFYITTLPACNSEV